VVVLRCTIVFCVTGACLALTWCRLRVTPSLPGGHRGNFLSTALFVPGETLGPVWSGQHRRVDAVSLLEAVVWYGVLQSTWSVRDKTGGAAVAGHHCFVSSPLLSFILFLDIFLLLPSIFLYSNYAIAILI
jgi:hypothetical protein